MIERRTDTETVNFGHTDMWTERRTDRETLWAIHKGFVFKMKKIQNEY